MTLDDFASYDEYAEATDIPLMSRPLLTWNVDWGFGLLTESDKAAIRDAYPSIDERMNEWARHVISLPLQQRALAIAQKVAVLDGLYPDPAGMCKRAIREVRHA